MKTVKMLILILTLTLASKAQPSGFQFLRSATDTLTRPNNYTAYAAGDAINDSTSANPDVFVFSFGGLAEQDGIVHSLTVGNDTASVQNLRLHLFNDSTDIPRIHDNAALNLTWTYATFPRYIGYIDITDSANTTLTSSDGYGQAFPVGPSFSFAASSTTLYGVLQAREAITPKALNVYRLTLRILTK